MQGTKLYNLLHLLSAREWKAFGKFLRSPYLNSNKRLLVFYEKLKKYFPDLDHSKLGKGRLFKELFPEKKEYDDRRMRALMSELAKAAERFLALQALDSDPALEQKLLIKSLGNRNHYPAFERKIEAFIDHMENQDIRNAGYYYDRFELNSLLYFHPQTKKFRPTNNALLSGIENLDRYYILTRLRGVTEWMAREKSLAEKHKIRLTEEQIRMANKFGLENPVFLIYLQIFQIQSNMHDGPVFQDLVENVKINIKKFSHEDQLDILPLLLNHANRRSTQGESSYLRIQFELYQLGLEHRLWMVNEQLPTMVFYNIVVLGAILKAFDWTVDFINNYKKQIDKNDFKVVLPLAKAQLSLHQKEFKTAETLLRTLKGNTPVFELIIRRLHLQVLYELYEKDESYFELIYSMIEAFQKYLYRNKNFSKTKLERDQNFVKMVKKMIMGTSGNEKAKKQFWECLSEELANEKAMTSRTWLREKLIH